MQALLSSRHGDESCARIVWCAPNRSSSTKSLTDMSHISACVGTTVASETRPRYSFSLAELRRRSAARQRELLWRRMLAGRTDFASLEVVSRGLAGRASGTASSRVDVPVSGLAIERASSTLCACMFGVAARRVNER